MADGCDVAIIGGGVMGASVAFWLTRMQPGLAVTVIERDPTYAQAATALSMAQIRQQFTTPVNVALSRFGIEFIRDFARWTGPSGGVADLGLVENGYLFVTGSQEAASRMEEMAAMQRSLGAATQVLDRAALSARFPWIKTSDLVAGSFGPRDEGWFDNMGLLGGLRNAARAQGARFVTGEVTGFDLHDSRVAGVHLQDGTRLACATAVCAAGTRTSGLLAGTGLAIPVEPRKRTVFVIDAPNARATAAPFLIDHGFYLRPEHRHWLTATVPDQDMACDINDFHPELHLFEEAIWEPLFHRCPGFDAVKVIRHWVGHYDFNTLDQNAILGPHPALGNLYLCNGFSGHGLQQSPGIGRGMAEHILTGGWQSIDLDDLSVDRVLRGVAFRETAVI